MTTDVDVETTVRGTLARWADGVRPLPADPDAALRRVEARRRRRRNRVAGALAAGAAVAVVIGGAVTAERSSSIRTGAGGGAGGVLDVVPLGDPALLALDVPGWTVEYATLGTNGADVYPTRTADVRFTNGLQSIEIVAYPLGSRDDQHSTGTVVVRGVEGRLIPEGPDRVRIDWDEGGQTLEADGSPFASPDELVAVLEQVRVVDDAGYVASLPAGVGAAMLAGIRSYPLDVPGFVTWYPGEDVACMVDDGSAATPHPADPTTGC